MTQNVIRFDPITGGLVQVTVPDNGIAVAPSPTTDLVNSLVNQPMLDEIPNRDFVSVGVNSPGAPLMSTTVTDATNNSANCRALVFAPLLSDITDIQLGFVGFSQSSGTGPVVLPNAYTVSGVSVEYPLGTTPKQVFFPGGGGSVTVSPGVADLRTLSLPVFIPRGAQFAIKTDLAWTGTMMFGSAGATKGTDEWCTRGTGVAAHYLDNTVLATTTSGTGFRPLVYAKLNTRLPTVVLFGDSRMAGSADQIDANSWAIGWMKRALRGKVPVINLAMGGTKISDYLVRPDVFHNLTRRNITHVHVGWGINDLNGGQSVSTVQSNLQAFINPMLTRGVQISLQTIEPNTTATNHWLDTAQTPSASNANRIAYNNWLRANWKSLGAFQLVDADLAIDANQDSLWDADPGATLWTTGQSAVGAPTMAAGRVSSVAYTPGWQFGGTAGSGYPNNLVTDWWAVPFPGDTGSGASGTATVNGSGQITTYTVTNPGNGYNSVPLINIRQAFSPDGLHANYRGCNELIAKTGASPAMFNFNT